MVFRSVLMQVDLLKIANEGFPLAVGAPCLHMGLRFESSSVVKIRIPDIGYMPQPNPIVVSCGDNRDSP